MLQNLYTRQGKALIESGKTPWDCYPRPQMRRDSFLNLNGIWNFSVACAPELPQTYSEEILVPFCPESLLSGLHKSITPGDYLFYRRNFSLPDGFLRDRVLLHFGAVDQIADIYVNQKHVATHIGGYEAFTVDITYALEDTNELVVRVQDDLRSTVLPYGKQSLKRGGMWYTPVSGIWQTVWVESVPDNYIPRLELVCNGLSVALSTGGNHNGIVTVQTLTGQEVCPLQNGCAILAPDNPRLWSPEDPYLYRIKVQTETDTVESYFALRTLETKMVGGLLRLCLNGKPYFFHALLDQGYWSDGIFTPADPGCYEEDILTAKNLGFNTLRKHIKIEPEQFYYDCDRLGMLVFQDMVNNGPYSFVRDTALPTVGMQNLPDRWLHRHKKTREAFLLGMESTVKQLKNHPCIVYWTIFNEGWGQFHSDDAYRRLKALDNTRFIDTTSGWFRRKQTDIDSRHIYFGPWNQLKARKKPLLLSEFGGHTYAVEGHLFNPDKAYGYKTCQTQAQWQDSVETLYLTRILPAIPKGLCGAVLTQISDVEDEINGLCTYDRAVVKADPARMQNLAQMLTDGIGATK